MITSHSNRPVRPGSRWALALWLMMSTCEALSLLGTASAGELAGVRVVPHTVADALRYRRPRTVERGARVQLFVRGPATPRTFSGHPPAHWLETQAWAWHDLQTALPIPDGALGVWSFNTRTSAWGAGQSCSIEAEGLMIPSVPLDAPSAELSAVTALSQDGTAVPDQLVLHVVNHSDQRLALQGLRLWTPREGATWGVLWPRAVLPLEVTVPPRDRAMVRVDTGRLPLALAAIEVTTSAQPLWAHVRLKREAFDISGGWIFDSQTPWRTPANEAGEPQNPFLDLLLHLHVNTAHFEDVPGYGSQPALAARYPLKRFHKLWPLERWDTDEWLPQLHAVEFLGEPQYGGGRPVPPQEVFDQLLPYRGGRLATTVTHSEERIWRDYAGLSDYPHFDAYRVVAPAADSWREYDRWNGRRIAWGAPLETIGDLTRSLRDLNRPAPIAVWSQGPHHGWGGGGFFGGGRKRRSPTPDELRSQALHALSARITSLYWFNLSLKSLVRFPDTWEPMTRIGREIRMLEPLYLAGDAHHFERVTTADQRPDWDLSVIAAPQGAVLFALDTAYLPDPERNEFVFGEPRPARFEFPLPHSLRNPADLFRVDADGVHAVTWQPTATGVVIEETASRDRIYVASHDAALREQVESRRQAALRHEATYPIDRDAVLNLLPR
jgi:hypothetical protein